MLQQTFSITLKRVLKYAPLKSDFVKAIVQDGSIKTEISDDMYEVKNDNIFEAEYTEVDVNTVTGEVVENGGDFAEEMPK